MHVQMAYEGTRLESPLRKLVVDMYRDLEDEERNSVQWTRFKRNCDIDFLADVSESGRREKGASAIKARQAYMV